jgi:TonB family protein
MDEFYSDNFTFLLVAFPLVSKDMSPAPRPSRLLCFFLFVCSCRFPSTLQAQSTEADLNGRLMDKPLYLRGSWRDDNLRFDSAGQLKGKSGPVTFILCGFEFKSLRIKQDKLILEGRRIGLEFSDHKQVRVPLNVGKPGRPEDESMRIEIAASPSGDYGPALDAIFANGLAELVPSMPSYWQPYALKNFTAIDSSTTPGTPVANPAQQPADSPDAKPRRIGDAVTPPKLLRSKEPEFSDAARGLKYSGTVLINLWLQPDGAVSHLSLVRPIGLGLDERALAAVQKYTFSPARMNDKPVLVELNIEVNFQIF